MIVAVICAFRNFDGWCARNVKVAATLGPVLGLVGLVCIGSWSPIPPQSSLAERVAGILYLTGAWIWLALLFGMVTKPLVRFSAGRTGVAVIGAIITGVLSLFVATSSGLRMLAGSHLTMGAIDFTTNSWRLLARELAAYSGWFIGLGAFGLAVTLGNLVFLLGYKEPKCPSSPWPSKAASLVALALGAVLAGIFTARSTPFARGMFADTPVLAFVISFEEGADPDQSDVMLAQAAVDPLAGPPRSVEASWYAAVANSRGPRPNVLLVVLEAIRLNHLGFEGYHRPTPEFDQLAREGVRMRRAWTTATHSNYAQPAILSSLFPRRRQSLDQYTVIHYPRFLFHDLFYELGYDTATFSSQDENWQGMRRFQDTGTPTTFFDANDIHHQNHPEPGPVPDDQTVDRVIQWMARPRVRPWAVYVNLQATHFPYFIPDHAPRPYAPSEPTPSTFTYLSYPEEERDIVINRYDNALAFVDAQIGRIRRALHELGHLDDTLWIVTADHGENFQEHDYVTHGWTLYETESRVPLLLRWPGRIGPEIRDDPVSLIDILPTVCELLDIPPHPSYQGTSFWKPASTARRPIYMNIQGLRFADAMVCWPWKLIIERRSGQAFLFHLVEDPDERRNLYDIRSEVANGMEQTLNVMIRNQMTYHVYDDHDVRFQPRLPPCPDLP